MLYRAMRYFAERLSLAQDIEKWKAREQELILKINAELWSESDGFYFDRKRSDGRFSSVLSPAGFMPLFIGIAPTDRAHRMAALAASKDHFFPGMPTVSYDHPEFSPGGKGPTWRGATWLNVAYFALRGLMDYGFTDVADGCRNTILEWIVKNDDAIYERYDSLNGEGGGFKHFGWSAAFTIEFILNWPNVTPNKTR